MKDSKEKILQALKEHIACVQGNIEIARKVAKELGNKSLKEIKSLSPEDQAIALSLKHDALVRYDELGHLYSSPFFVKCIIRNSDGQTKSFYFAKHQFSDEQIYSWVAPISSVRFDQPGPVSYGLPDGSVEQATLLHKEQYLIVDGKVMFFALEDGKNPRELVYQEHFSTRKHGFVLPEIVAVMEKAQDKVIRAHHAGPFVISGPAGSGKTTLALHRVAYLVQAPDTAPSYPGKSIIVFVQDTGTKEYFSQLLPELGIKDVTITTFSEWAFKCLGIKAGEMTFMTKQAYLGSSSGQTEANIVTEAELDLMEYEKIQCLRAFPTPRYTKQSGKLLTSLYELKLSPRSMQIFESQIMAKKLDKIDLTLLLSSYIATFGGIELTQSYLSPAKHGQFKRKTRKAALDYSLLVVDEFQNYLPEQLNVFKRVVNQANKSIIYVGDMAQQVNIGTIRDWASIQENFVDDRRVILDKVYRNTKQILGFIGELGYKVTVPRGLKEGLEVSERVFSSKSEEMAHIKDFLDKNLLRASKNTQDSPPSIAILARNKDHLVDLAKTYENKPNIHILSIAEAQGVEFDKVLIAGVSRNSFSVSQSLPVSLVEEKRRIERDLLYVGLTRAISELHVVGECRLRDAFEDVSY